MELCFPKDFIWGVATASYQIEGAYNEDGRGESIWDRFSKTPGNTLNSDTGDVACDHYHRYQEDIKLIKSLGVDAYRFSIAWPRIFPNGYGKPNLKGLDFYKRVIEELHKHNLIPFATLYHWDLPQSLQDKGGWANRDTAKYFSDYAYYLFNQLGASVPNWITHNEPWCAANLGYGNGHHAPGIKDKKQAVQAGHHLLYSHGLAVQAYRAAGLWGQIGITLNLSPKYPASAEEEDIQAALRADALDNRWFLDPVLIGEYPKFIWEIYSEHGLEPKTQADDLKIMSTPIDFLGVNYYSRSIIGSDHNNMFGFKHYPGKNEVTEMGWEIYPQGLYDLLIRLKNDYNNIPLYITENGACFKDQLINDRVYDQQRKEYLKQHFAAACKALSQQVPLKGYFVWSLMDNFEWAFGYERRFGIVYIDYPTQQRFLKDSAKWYRDFLNSKRS